MDAYFLGVKTDKYVEEYINYMKKQGIHVEKLRELGGEVKVLMIWVSLF